MSKKGYDKEEIARMIQREIAKAKGEVEKALVRKVMDSLRKELGDDFADMMESIIEPVVKAKKT